MNFKNIWMLVFAGIVSSLGTDFAGAQGVFVYKKQSFHKDEDAHAIEYSKIEVMPPIDWVTTAGNRIRFEKHTFHTWLEYPDVDFETLATDVEIDWFKERFRITKNFYTRFPKARPLLENRFQKMQEMMSKLGEGYVMIDRQWITRAEYADRKLKADQEIAREVAKMEQEKRKKKEQEMIERLKVEETRRKEMELIKAQNKAVTDKRVAELEAKIAERKDEIRSLNEKIEFNANHLNRLLP